MDQFSCGSQNNRNESSYSESAAASRSRWMHVDILARSKGVGSGSRDRPLTYGCSTVVLIGIILKTIGHCGDFRVSVGIGAEPAKSYVLHFLFRDEAFPCPPSSSLPSSPTSCLPALPPLPPRVPPRRSPRTRSSARVSHLAALPPARRQTSPARVCYVAEGAPTQPTAG